MPPEATAKTMTDDGWIRTGDAGYLDADGYLTIVDRKKEVIVAGGFNVYPREVDDVLLTHPKILEACTIGVPDEYRGETVKSYIVLRAGQKADSEEIIAHCRGKLAPYKAPRHVRFIDSLPATGAGKVLRRLLKDVE